MATTSKKQVIKGNIPTQSKGKPFKFEIHKRLQGKSLLKPFRSFDEYSELLYIGRSGEFYHFLGENRFILICTIIL